MLNLRRLFHDYHEKARAFAELLPWMAQVGPDVVVNKDGSLLVCYQWEGVDMEGLLPMEVDRYANLAEHALRVFDDRITVWSTTLRKRTLEFPEGEFDSEIGAMINDVWKKQFQQGTQFVNNYYWSVLYSPPSGANGFLEKVAYFTLRGHGFMGALFHATKASLSLKSQTKIEADQLERYLADLDDKLGGFEQTLTDLNMRRLRGEELRSFLHVMSNPASPLQPVKEMRVPAYLDSFLCENTLNRSPDTLEFKGATKKAYAAAISIKDWPESTYPGIWDMLTTVPGEMCISQCFRYLENSTAEKYIRDKERHNRNLSIKLMGYIKQALSSEQPTQVDEGRIRLAEDAAEALAQKTLGQIFGYYSMTVVAYGDTPEEAEQIIKQVSSIMRGSGFLVVRENLHLLSSWAGTLPGQWAEMVRWYFCKTSNMADLLPLRTLHTGSKVNKHLSEQMASLQPALTVLPTEYATPFYFSFHVGDVGHTLVVGPAGAGKSSFLNFLISQFRKHRPCNIFIFDKDKSCRISTLLQGGSFLDLGAEDGTRPKLNPMLLIRDEGSWRWLAKWLEMLLTSRNYKLTSTDDQSIWAALESVAVQGHELWRLRSLINHLPHHLAIELQPWVGDGQFAEFFDNQEDSFDLGDFTCCEMGRLMRFPRVASAFLEYAFYRINEKLDGRPTIIEIEEAWFMLSDPVFGPRIDDWLRTLRKRNAFVIMATQSLTEIAESEIFATIIDNIPNKIFLPNENALAHEELYKRKFALNDQQLSRIRNAVRKRDYYIVTPELSRMVVGRLPAEIMACVRSDTRAQELFSKFYANGEGGADWKSKYLNTILAG